MGIIWYFDVIQGNSRGYLYHDDFNSLAYRQGEYVLREVTMKSASTLSSRQVQMRFIESLVMVSRGDAGRHGTPGPCW